MINTLTLDRVAFCQPMGDNGAAAKLSGPQNRTRRCGAMLEHSAVGVQCWVNTRGYDLSLMSPNITKEVACGSVPKYVFC